MLISSGKTYHALKALSESKSGVYCGPLRLLAYEIYQKMNNEWNIPCKLITGEEKLDPIVPFTEKPKHAACTVEMVDLEQEIDCAVIDEIQLLSDPLRGWAWTDALLHLPAKQIHVCGEERTLQLLLELTKYTKDTVKVHSYNRLSPLNISPTSLKSDLRNLQKGDCVVAFSKSSIYKIQELVQRQTGLKCAMIYGSLPPATRCEQAKLFNDGYYDVLIASDAIGMGLNLAIKRIVFFTLKKFDGSEEKLLEIPLVKQIAGRAGRYALPKQNLLDAVEDALSHSNAPILKENSDRGGLVTTLEQKDFHYLKKAMSSHVEPIQKAGIQPHFSIFEDFYEQFEPGTKLVEVLEAFEKFSSTSGKYFLCGMEQLKQMAYIIDLTERKVLERKRGKKDSDQKVILSLQDKWTLVRAPLRTNEANEVKMFCEMLIFLLMAPELQCKIINIANLKEQFQSIVKLQTSPFFPLEKYWKKMANYKMVTDHGTLKDQNSFTSTIDLPQNFNNFFKSFNQHVLNNANPTKYYQYMNMLESLHRSCLLYSWLHYRFRRNFPSIMESRYLAKGLENVLDSVLKKKVSASVERSKFNIDNQGIQEMDI